MKRIVIAGGTGFVGVLAQRHFREAGYDVTVLTRSRPPVRERDGVLSGVTAQQWDGRTVGDWASAIDGADVVLNLAGRSVNCRYTARNKAAIYASRLDSTRAVGEAIGACATPPHVWLNMSTATIYRHAEDRAQDETTSEVGSGFSVDVAQQWERAFNEATTPNTRKVALRTAIVIDRGRNSPFEILLRLARLGLGGHMGSGRQMMSWIAGRDAMRAFEFLIDRDDLDGAVNIASPNPLTNRTFMRALRRAAGVPIGIPHPRWMLELGAVLIRTETELVLKSRWVLPTRLREAGFTFEHAEWPPTAELLVRGARQS